VNNYRKYGESPFSIAVIHGGPGAALEMAPVARELSSSWGVLEPVQTAASLDGQVDELKTVLENQANLPVTLIGFSWGAWLGFIIAARYPTLIKKLILISSGPFEEKYAAQINQTRLNRLNAAERKEFESVLKTLDDPAIKEKNTVFTKLGALATKADAYDPEIDNAEEINGSVDIFQGVWPAAAQLRKSGQLLTLAHQIKSPVVALHGDYDPHPAEGVQKPLSVILKNFQFVLLKNCGHKPWIERSARKEFFHTLKAHL